MEVERNDLSMRPPHPGEYLREDFLPEVKMNVSELAAHMGVTRQTLSRLLNEKSDVSTEMAIRLGQTFENGARFWAALQMQYDLWHAQSKFTDRIPPIQSNSAA